MRILPSSSRLTASLKNARKREGSPYGASPMILYSSELNSKPRCRVTSEYKMPIESFAEISCSFSSWLS